MASVTIRAAVNVFVAVALLAIAAIVLRSGRRRGESIVLGVFLVLVGVNFGADGLYLATRNLAFERAATVALALDPLYLLLFVTSHPYRRRGRLASALIAAVGAAAALSVVVLVFLPALAGVEDRPPLTAPAHVLRVSNLAIAYASAWFLAARTGHEAPTPMLAERSAWLVTAVGVAVVPRLAVLPLDFGLSPASALSGLAARAPAARVGLDGALQVGVALARVVLASGAGSNASRGGRALDRAFRRVAVASVLLLVAGAAAEITDLRFDVGVGPYLVLPLRWFAFAGVLVHGILSFDILDFNRARVRPATVLGAALGAAAGFLSARVVLDASGADRAIGLVASVALALAAGPPAALFARAYASRWDASPIAGSDRRLELYRAALESAWARGAPGRAGRARLNTDRRALRVTVDEARALEHVVATAAAGSRAAPLAPGAEPVAGLSIEHLAGEGAHGRVFEAFHHGRGERVVVKEIRAGSDRTGKLARERLLAELRPLDGFRHPNVVGLVDVHVGRGGPLLVMEHVRGESLADVLRRGPVPPAVAAGLLRGVLAGLAAAHARGIVHRDVKPANVLVGEDGRARVADFGIALVAGNDRVTEATASGIGDVADVVGTLAYMAPEQAVPGRRVGSAADLFAVGLVAYELVTGEPARDLRGYPVAVALGLVARSSVDVSRAPGGWRAFIERAVDPDPDRRSRSATEMAEAVPPTGLDPEGAR